MKLPKHFRNREEYNEYHRNYRKNNLLKIRLYKRNYNLKHRKKTKYKYDKKYNKTNALKLSARRRLRYAIFKGLIKRLPCQICGIKKRGKHPVHAHHYNYKKPYLVSWLCSQHHQDFEKGRIKNKVKRFDYSKFTVA